MAENGTPRALSTNQRKALEALLTCSTIGQAATVAGLGSRTLHRYLNDPDFKTELRKRQSAILAATTAALVGLAGDAVDALRDVIKDPDATNAEKTSAARAWLAERTKAAELDVVIERLEQLEKEVFS